MLSYSIESAGMLERDEELGWIQRSQQGDLEAFEELVGRYQRMIHALTYRMTGSMADAEDLAQEIFIRAYRQIGSFRGEAKFSSWLYRIGVNNCLNWKKSKGRREQLDQEWADSRQMTTGKNDELAAKVQEALLRLHAKQRAAVILTVFEEMNHAEAARLLNCSETTISWRVFAARKKLREILSRP